MTEKNLNPGISSGDPAALAEWIRNAKKGDINSYQKVYDLFARKVFNFIRRMVASIEEAEDLTQETFIAVYQKLGSLKDNNRFEPWLFRIARNFVYQLYRNRQPVEISTDLIDEDGKAMHQFADDRKNPDEEFQSQELDEVVAKVIAGLPEKYREVFVLSAVHRCSYQQIAEIVGRSLPSVKTDIHRARLEVRKRVKDYLR